MATSPSDQGKQNVLDWLDRMQASVRTAGTSGGAKAFRLSSRGPSNPLRGEGDDDSDGESEASDPTRGPSSTIHGHALGRGAIGIATADNDNEEFNKEEDDKLHSIPDSAVPLGLIANLSLSNSKRKGNVGAGAGGGVGGARGDDKEDEDDDNVVCQMILSWFGRLIGREG